MIDTILNETNKDKLTYIGHSQGAASILYSMVTNNQFISEKISLAVLLAPAALIG